MLQTLAIACITRAIFSETIRRANRDLRLGEIVSAVIPEDSLVVIVILFGVSGAGKTTLGQLLADDLGWKFYEGDDFHSQGNIDKMHTGVPLTDEDRWPWLESLRGLIERCLASKENAVLTCSALKKSYRSYLRVNAEVPFVYLHGSYELISSRLQGRHGHFMNPQLLQSQFATLEEPEAAEGVIPIELGRSPRELVDEIKRKLRLFSTS